MHRTYVGLPGRPVFWNDNYILRDAPRPDGAQPARAPEPQQPAVDFAYYSDRIRDLGSRSRPL